MSGGYFDYNQYRLNDMADQIRRAINKMGQENEFGDINHTYSPEVVEKFEETIYILEQAEAMAQRVDWLLSGDDGEESFLERWREEVPEYWNRPKKIRIINV